MSALLLSFQNSLAAAGFQHSAIFGGPRPERQAVGVVLGDLARVPADAYAVTLPSAVALRGAGRPLFFLPQIGDVSLKVQMAAVTRAAIDIFLKARNEGVRSLALAVPENHFFGNLDLDLCVKLILGAADMFWRTHPQYSLSHITVAVQATDFALKF